MIQSFFEIFCSQVDRQFGYRLYDANGVELLSKVGFNSLDECRNCVKEIRELISTPGFVRNENSVGWYRFSLFNGHNRCIGNGKYYESIKLRERGLIVLKLIVPAARIVIRQ